MTAAAVLCPAVVVAGWPVGHLLEHGPAEEAPYRQDVRPLPEDPPVEATAPEEAADFVRSAAVRVDAARRAEVSFSVHGADTDAPAEPASPSGRAPEPGHGYAVFDAASAPQFVRAFTTFGGTQVFRHGWDGERCLTATGPGTPQPTAVESPSVADGYLCTRDFTSAKLWEVLASSTDLEYAGEETAELVPLNGKAGSDRAPEGPERVPAHRYTGTFTTLTGGYVPESGTTVLTPVQGAEFELWIDGEGVPRRLVYEGGAGTGETYDYRRVS